MRHFVLLAAAAGLAACGAEPAVDFDSPSTTPIAGPMSAPILTPTLDVTGVVPGSSFDLTVTGVPAQARVWFLLSTRGQGPGPCNPSTGDCSDILGPIIVLDNVRADASGVATSTKTPPAGIPEQSIWFQAYAQSGADTGFSNVVERRLYDGDLDGFGLDDCDDSDPLAFPGPSDTDPFDFSDSDCDGFDGPPAYWDATYTIGGSLSLDAGFLGVFSCTPVGGGDIDHTRDPQVMGSAVCDLGALGIATVDLDGSVGFGSVVTATVTESGISGEVLDVEATLDDDVGGTGLRGLAVSVTDTFEFDIFGILVPVDIVANVTLTEI